MAFDRHKLFETAKLAIADNNLFFIEDIVAWLPCDKTTFYKYFPVKIDDEQTLDNKELKEVYFEHDDELVNGFNTLKAMLEENKVKTKSSIRAKLYKGNRAPELIALYKLICTDQERRSLSMQAIDHTTNNKDIPPTVINLGTGEKPDEVWESGHEAAMGYPNKNK